MTKAVQPHASTCHPCACHIPGPISVPCFLDFSAAFPTCDIGALPHSPLHTVATLRTAVYLPPAMTGGFPSFSVKLPPFDLGLSYSSARFSHHQHFAALAILKNELLQPIMHNDVTITLAQAQRAIIHSTTPLLFLASPLSLPLASPANRLHRREAEARPTRPYVPSLAGRRGLY